MLCTLNVCIYNSDHLLLIDLLKNVAIKNNFPGKLKPQQLTSTPGMPWLHKGRRGEAPWLPRFQMSWIIIAVAWRGEKGKGGGWARHLVLSASHWSARPDVTSRAGPQRPAPPALAASASVWLHPPPPTLTRPDIASRKGAWQPSYWPMRLVSLGNRGTRRLMVERIESLHALRSALGSAVWSMGWRMQQQLLPCHPTPPPRSPSLGCHADQA